MSDYQKHLLELDSVPDKLGKILEKEKEIQVISEVFYRSV